MDNKTYVSKIKTLKSKLKKFEKKAKRLTDTNEILDNDLKIAKYKDRIKKIVSKNIFNDSNKLSDFENKINKISNGYVLPSKVYSKSKNVFRVVLNKNIYSKFNKSYTRKDIENIGLKISKKLNDYGLDGEITTTLNFNGVVRSGYRTNIGNNIKIFNPNDIYEAGEDEIKYYENIKSFDDVVFWITVNNENAEFGGSSSFNDCFWFCLNNGISQYNPWKTPEELKSFLKFGRCDLVGLKDIERIEKKLVKLV